MNSSWRRMRILRARRITFARSSKPAAAHAGCAARALWTAERTSAAVATVISPIFSLVTGLETRRRRAPPELSMGSTMAMGRLLRTSAPTLPPRRGGWTRNVKHVLVPSWKPRGAGCCVRPTCSNTRTGAASAPVIGRFLAGLRDGPDRGRAHRRRARARAARRVRPGHRRGHRASSSRSADTGVVTTWAWVSEPRREAAARSPLRLGAREARRRRHGDAPRGRRRSARADEDRHARARPLARGAGRRHSATSPASSRWERRDERAGDAASRRPCASSYHGDRRERTSRASSPASPRGASSAGAAPRAARSTCRRAARARRAAWPSTEEVARRRRGHAHHLLHRQRPLRGRRR